MAKSKLEIPVYCSYDEMVPLGKLIRNPRNPNTHPDNQIKLLCKIIGAQGWRNPIVVSKRSGFITKGHARLTVAEILEVETAPVDYQDYATEAEEWADMIADNRIAELAEMDRPLLKDLLEEIDSGEFDMDLMGFDSEALERLMNEIHPVDYSDQDQENASLAGMEEIKIDIEVPAKYKEQIITWLANGEPLTAPGLGVGIMKRCGLLS